MVSPCENFAKFELADDKSGFRIRNELKRSLMRKYIGLNEDKFHFTALGSSLANTRPLIQVAIERRDAAKNTSELNDLSIHIL